MVVNKLEYVPSHFGYNNHLIKRIFSENYPVN